MIEFQEDTKLIEVPLVLSTEIKKAFGIDDSVLFWWTYRSVYDDECIVIRFYGDVLKEGDADLIAFLQLMEENPHLKEFNLGSSEHEAEQCLLVDNKRPKAYIVSLQDEHRIIRDLIKMKKLATDDG